MACLGGPCEEVQSKIQAESMEGPGSHDFIRVYGWNALGFLSNGQICQFKPRKWCFDKLGDLFKGVTKERPWIAG